MSRAVSSLHWTFPPMIAALSALIVGCGGSGDSSGSSAGSAGAAASGNSGSAGSIVGGSSGSAGASGSGGVAGASGSAGASGNSGAAGGGFGGNYCDGSGPPVLVGDNGQTETCLGNVAATTFRYALCLCEDYVNSVTLHTDSFDSTQGPFTNPENGGSVGVNGRVDANGVVKIGGTLIVGSELGVQAGGAGEVDIAGELRDGGPFRSGAPLSVKHDAKIKGELRASSLDIGGTLTVPAGENIDISGSNHTGALVRAPVSAEEPCACADSQILDVASLVQEQKIHAQNTDISLGEDELSNYSGPVDKTLPCGVYYLSRIGGQGDLTLHITGRTALLIGGDVAPGGTFKISIEGGELDLFVQGGIVSSAPMLLGSQDAPAKVRVYVGGVGTIQLSASSVFGGNLYAPRAEIVTSGAAELYGSVFARRLAASDAVTIHYDTAVLNAGVTCDPPTGCNSCNDCGNQACVNGACGSCTDSSQCCSPLVCENGTCVPFIQ